MRQLFKDINHSQPRATEQTGPQTPLCTNSLGNPIQIFSKASGPGTRVDKRQTVPALLDSKGDKHMAQKAAKMPGFSLTDKINPRSKTYHAVSYTLLPTGNSECRWPLPL